jgi:16S rRNA (cytosine1402-N4)-methyltransferase
MNVVHVPVMREEVIENMNLKNSGVYVDGTVGLGGHAEEILHNAKGCTLIGIDRDQEALDRARERLMEYGNVHLVREIFSNMKPIVNSLGYSEVNGILLDLGVSTLHLKSGGRGFSFLKDEPLDMRMDKGQDLTAEKIINTYPEKDLADLIWKYGDERRSRRIAKSIVYARQKSPVRSCRELAVIIEKSIGRRGKIHPATRTFQAVRIEVNRELEQLTTALETGAGMLAVNGRLCVISYHSLEDRIVKNAFKELAKKGLFRIITKKPLTPGQEEKKVNPSSRSAKLRAAERLS